MPWEKRPVDQAAPPSYPDREQAAIHRRRFLALVGGGAAAVLAGACGDESCERSGADLLPGGKPPDLQPGPAGTRGPDGGVATPGPVPPGAARDAAPSPSSASEAAGRPDDATVRAIIEAKTKAEAQRRASRTRRKKIRDRIQLGGDPVGPEFEL